MEVGIDIEQNKRFALEKNATFLTTNFTQDEIEYAFSKSKPEMHLCGIFCAKEAIKKTFQKGESVSLSNIKIKRNNSKPRAEVIIDGRKSKEEFKISISHCDDYAVAQAVRMYEK